ncbi:Dehydrogenase/ reductase [Triangularia verruculosa]|uniref:Dehydrogenase/ reductase n=1 Tax=Triangularia verruculosa TaxID=2587418 RepID=A0AAN6X550_9PEZI|nr:Dehydrogenase/ reductase [Triangularia verruculosa]
MSSQSSRRSDTYPFIDPERFKHALNNQVALVTGAGRGIGREIALALARAGATVACLARTESEVADVVNEISRQGLPRGMPVVADLSQLAEIDRALALITTTLGPIDILVNNAGIDRIGAFSDEADFDAWWHVVEVNLRAPAALIHRVLPSMTSRRGRGGVIISIGSRNAVHNHPFMTAYSATKTALLRLHQCLELELQHTDVRLFYVQPGDVATALMGGRYSPEEAARRPELAAMVARMRAAMDEGVADSPALVADTCVMLAASDEARLLSGLYVDANQDLGKVLDEAGKGSESRIARERLYTLKADLLDT